ncbi:MAG: TPM domain-containing protein [Thermoanaerobaculia bacterium]
MRELHRTCLIVTLVLILVLSALPARAVGIEEITNPRPTGWVTDMTGALSPTTVAELNRLGAEVKARTGAELEVVVIGTTGGAGSHAFATQLFNTWRIGDQDRNDGVLVFAALEDRAAEIVLGDGLDSTAAFKASDEIMQGEMLPLFRAGDPDGAILQGARACAVRILNVQVPAPAPASVKDAQPQLISFSATTAAAEAPEADPGVPFARYGWVGALLGVLSIGLWVANRPVRCERCREEMILLSESEDDAHLARDEQIEEQIGSVNYEIWHCHGCGAIQRSRFARIFSPYKKCPG